LHVDNNQIYDHLVDASIIIMKYLNDPHDGCIGPQISLYIRFEKEILISIFLGDGLIINFPL